MLRFILLLASGSAALAQQYTISTVAGGSPPVTPVSATGVSIGQPQRVTTDAAGNVYFSSGNTVYKINGSGSLTVVAGNSRAGFSGDGGPAVNAQLNGPQGLAVDSAGNLYIADAINNRIRIVSPAGIINTFAGNGKYSQGGGPGTFNDGGPATDGLLNQPHGVAVDKSGNVYIADTGDNTIRKVTTDGIINTIVGDSYPGFLADGGNATSAELNHPADVAVDSSGKIYIADTNNAAIRVVTTDGLINTFAGNQTIGYSGDDGLATKAGLIAPMAVAVDGSGNVFLAENGDSRIRRVDTKSIIVTVAGTNSIGYGGDSNPANKTPLNSPTGVAVDSSGNFYIADSLNLRVRKVTSSAAISTIAGNGVLSYAGDNGPAVNGQMNAPQGVAVDSSGNLYISDAGNNVVRRVSKGVITTYAGTGASGNSGDGAAATSAQLNIPQGLAVDSAGNLYIADSQNAKVRKVSASGSISTVAGSGTVGFGGDGAAAGSAQLNTPVAVAVDGAGNLYIADLANNRVRKVSTSGTISTVAGNGNAGYSGDGGAATSASLNLPSALAVDSAGNLYIADANNVIRMVNANGTISTIVGNGIAGFSGDGGPATKAQIASPRAITVDAVGNVFFTDGGTRVREIVFPNRTITTIAGNGVRGYSGDGGPAVNAQLSTPSGLAIDSTGILYIADTGNTAVRSLQLSGPGVSVKSVVSAASGVTGPLAPGEVIALYGSGLGPATLVQSQLDSNGLIPRSLAGTSVLINGAAAPILYTSAGQVAAIVPYEVTGPAAQIVVFYQGQSSAAVSGTVAAVSPAIFTLNASGTGQAAAINADGTVNGADHPAKAGAVVSIYATGAGQTNPTGENGKPGAVPLPQPVLPVTATIGGKTATVQYAGGAQGLVAGVIQVNLVVPTGLTAGPVQVVLQQGNISSPAGVTIVVNGN